MRGSKDKFVAELERRIAGIPGHVGSICERSDLITRAKTLYAGRAERCGRFILDIDLWLEKIEEIRINPIWGIVIAGNKDIDISALIDELGNSAWVDQGRRYLKPNSKICPFCQRETITDTMRRIIENYFGMLGKGKDDSLVNCFTEPEDQMIARSLIAWINDGSHSIPDDLYIDSYTDAVPKYKEVFKRMFYESGHKAHYNMMMKISDEPEEGINNDNND